MCTLIIEMIIDRDSEHRVSERRDGQKDTVLQSSSRDHFKRHTSEPQTAGILFSCGHRCLRRPSSGTVGTIPFSLPRTHNTPAYGATPAKATLYMQLNHGILIIGF